MPWRQCQRRQPLLPWGRPSSARRRGLAALLLLPAAASPAPPALCGEFELPACLQAEFEDSRLPAVSGAALRLLPGGALRERGSWSADRGACERQELPVQYEAGGLWEVLPSPAAEDGAVLLNVTLSSFRVTPSPEGQVCSSPHRCLKVTRWRGSVCPCKAGFDWLEDPDGVDVLDDAACPRCDVFRRRTSYLMRVAAGYEELCMSRRAGAAEDLLAPRRGALSLCAAKVFELDCAFGGGAASAAVASVPLALPAGAPSALRVTSTLAVGEHGLLVAELATEAVLHEGGAIYESVEVRLAPAGGRAAGAPQLRIRAAGVWRDAGPHELLAPARRLQVNRSRVMVALAGGGGAAEGPAVCVSDSAADCLPARLWLQLLCPCGGLAWPRGGEEVDVAACPAGEACAVRDALAWPSAFLLALPGPPLCLSEPRGRAFEGWGVVAGRRWSCHDGSSGGAPVPSEGGKVLSAAAVAEAARSRLDAAEARAQALSSAAVRARAAAQEAGTWAAQSLAEVHALEASWRVAHEEAAAELSRQEAAEAERRRNRSESPRPGAVVYELPDFKGRSVAVPCCAAVVLDFPPGSAHLDLGIVAEFLPAGPAEDACAAATAALWTTSRPSASAPPGASASACVRLARGGGPAAAGVTLFAGPGFLGAFQAVAEGDYTAATLRIEGPVVSCTVAAGWRVSVRPAASEADAGAQAQLGRPPLYLTSDAADLDQELLRGSLGADAVLQVERLPAEEMSEVVVLFDLPGCAGTTQAAAAARHKRPSALPGGWGARAASLRVPSGYRASVWPAAEGGRPARRSAQPPEGAVDLEGGGACVELPSGLARNLSRLSVVPDCSGLGDCGDHGDCTAPGKCVCRLLDGWAGPDCSLRIPDKTSAIVCDQASAIVGVPVACRFVARLGHEPVPTSSQLVSVRAASHKLGTVVLEEVAKGHVLPFTFTARKPFGSDDLQYRGLFDINVQYLPIFGSLIFQAQLEAHPPPVAAASELRCDAEALAPGALTRCIVSFRGADGAPCPVPARGAVSSATASGLASEAVPDCAEDAPSCAAFWLTYRALSPGPREADLRVVVASGVAAVLELRPAGPLRHLVGGRGRGGQTLWRLLGAERGGKPPQRGAVDDVLERRWFTPSETVVLAELLLEHGEFRAASRLLERQRGGPAGSCATRHSARWCSRVVSLLDAAVVGERASDAVHLDGGDAPLARCDEVARAASLAPLSAALQIGGARCAIAQGRLTAARPAIARAQRVLRAGRWLLEPGRAELLDLAALLALAELRLAAGEEELALRTASWCAARSAEAAAAPAAGAARLGRACRRLAAGIEADTAAAAELAAKAAAGDWEGVAEAGERLAQRLDRAGGAEGQPAWRHEAERALCVSHGRAGRHAECAKHCRAAAELAEAAVAAGTAGAAAGGASLGEVQFHRARCLVALGFPEEATRAALEALGLADGAPWKDEAMRILIDLLLTDGRESEREKDLYEVLGVPRTAGLADIKRAYRQLAMRYHPDKNPGDPMSEKLFIELSEAYQVLSDPDLRARYDSGEASSSLRREAGSRGGAGRAGGASGGGGGQGADAGAGGADGVEGALRVFHQSAAAPAGAAGGGGLRGARRVAEGLESEEDGFDGGWDGRVPAHCCLPGPV